MVDFLEYGVGINTEDILRSSGENVIIPDMFSPLTAVGENSHFWQKPFYITISRFLWVDAGYVVKAYFLWLTF